MMYDAHRSPIRTRLIGKAVGAVLALAGATAQAEFTRENGVGISLYASEHGEVCGGCPVDFRQLVSTELLSAGMVLEDSSVGENYLAFAHGERTGSFSGLVGWAASQANGGRRLGEGVSGAAFNPNTTFHGSASGTGEFSMLLINDQSVTMRYTVSVDIAGTLSLSSNHAGAPVQVWGGATAFAREPDPYGEGGDVLGFWYDSAFASGAGDTPVSLAGSFSLDIASGESFWLWGYSGSYAQALNTSLDPNAGVAGIDGFAGNSVEVSLSAVPAPVPEPGALAMSLAGVGVVGLLVRRRRPPGA